MICPSCKANNHTGPNCRRCKSDLSLLIALETRLTWLREQALLALSEGQPRIALQHLHEAWFLKPVPECLRWQAWAYLQLADYSAAHRCFQLAQAA